VERSDFEHILRAAAAITGQNEFVLNGSQSLLGEFPDAPGALRVSDELDIIVGTPGAPEEGHVSDLIDGTIGELSPFHSTFGYYAHGVAFKTAVFPSGWEERAIRVRTERTGGATGVCMEDHDLAASKLAAGRPKDLIFVAQLLLCGLASEAGVGEQIALMPLDSTIQATLGLRLIAAKQLRTC